jgi:uncharacterized membrane protein
MTDISTRTRSMSDWRTQRQRSPRIRSLAALGVPTGFLRANGLDVSGLRLAGIVLGAAGALDDVTITQASTVCELQEANPSLDRKERVRGALRVGRDHIASMVNTLLLAYAGASLPLLVLFVLAHQSLGTIANSEVVAVEIVRTLVGSIGLVAAVPLTTWLAARFYHEDGEPVS